MSEARINRLISIIRDIPMPVNGIIGTRHFRRIDYLIMRHLALLEIDPKYSAEKLAGEWPCLELGLYDLRNYESMSCNPSVLWLCSRWQNEHNIIERLMLYPIVSEQEVQLMGELCLPRKGNHILRWFLKLEDEERNRLRIIMAKTLRSVFESGVDDSLPLVMSAWRLRNGPSTL